MGLEQKPVQTHPHNFGVLARELGFNYHTLRGYAIRQGFNIHNLSEDEREILRMFKPKEAPTKKPLNSLGLWLTQYATETETSLTALRRNFDLPGLVHATRNPESRISLYTLQQVLIGAQNTGASEEQMDSLRSVVEAVIQQTLSDKGKLYDRVPPIVPRRVSKRLNCVTYTDASFSRTILSTDAQNPNAQKHLAARISSLRNKFGFSPVFTEEQAQVIKNRLEDLDKKSGEQGVKNKFLESIALVPGVEEQIKGSTWLRKEKGYPNPEEFGDLLIKTQELSEDEKEELITKWLEEFRGNISLTNTAYVNEFRTSRQAIQQMAKKIDPEEKLSAWDRIEKIRERKELRNHSIQESKEKITNSKKGTENSGKRGRKPKNNSIASLARELDVSYQVIYNSAKRLGIANTNSLTDSDIRRIRKYRILIS